MSRPSPRRRVTLRRTVWTLFASRLTVMVLALAGGLLALAWSLSEQRTYRGHLRVACAGEDAAHAGRPDPVTLHRLLRDRDTAVALLGEVRANHLPTFRRWQHEQVVMTRMAEEPLGDAVLCAVTVEIPARSYAEAVARLDEYAARIEGAYREGYAATDSQPLREAAPARRGFGRPAPLVGSEVSAAVAGVEAVAAEDHARPISAVWQDPDGRVVRERTQADAQADADANADADADADADGSAALPTFGSVAAAEQAAQRLRRTVADHREALDDLRVQSDRLEREDWVVPAATGLGHDRLSALVERHRRLERSERLAVGTLQMTENHQELIDLRREQEQLAGEWSQARDATLQRIADRIGEHRVALAQAETRLAHVGEQVELYRRPPASASSTPTQPFAAAAGGGWPSLEPSAALARPEYPPPYAGRPRAEEVLIGQPFVEETAVRPRLSRNVGLGLLVGLLVALGWVLLRTGTDQRITSPADLDDLGLNVPVFGSVPEIRGSRSAAVLTTS